MYTGALVVLRRDTFVVGYFAAYLVVYVSMYVFARFLPVACGGISR